MADVFISYRRGVGASVARLMRSLLKERGIKSFLDVDDLRSGHFDAALLEQIEAAPGFLVVLSPGSLDRCAEPGDWLCREISHALSTQRTIVPLLMPDFDYPAADTLPEQIRPILTFNGVRYSHEFIDAVLDKIVSFLPEPRSSHDPNGSQGQPEFPELIMVRWTARMPGEVSVPPSMAPDGSVGLLTSNGALVRVSADGIVESTAVIGGGRGLGGQALRYCPLGWAVAVTDGYLSRVEPDGSQAWRWTTRGSVTAPPALNSSGTVFAMSNRSALSAVSSTGQEFWSTPLCRVHGGGTWPGPVVRGDTVFAACKGRSVFGVHAETGEVMWEFSINDSVSATPGLSSAGVAHFASDGGWVHAIDKAGHQSWVTSVSGGSGKIASIDAPVVAAADGTVLVTPRHGVLYALSSTGEHLWEAALGGQGTGARPVAVADDGTVYAVTTHRELIGLSASGREFLRFASDSKISAPGVGPDGTVYLVLGTTLYALRIAQGPTHL
jgi:outer membrane protein assembly factor BamB